MLKKNIIIKCEGIFCEYEDAQTIVFGVPFDGTASFKPGARFGPKDIREQMDLDSMDLLNIVAGLHERLDVEIPESDVEQIVTINSALAYLSG